MTQSIRSYAAVVFDFDGTLIDSYTAIAASVNYVRDRRKLPPLAVDEVKRHVGRGAEYLLTHTVPGGVLADDLAIYREHHPSVVSAYAKLLPGAADVIVGLHRAGKKVGLCSNKPRVFSEQILKHLKLAQYFGAVVGPEDAPLPKPAPDMLRITIERLDVPSEQTLYIGDMVVDIQTARAAGVRVWVLPTGSDDRHTLDLAKPDRVLTDLQELVAEIGRI